MFEKTYILVSLIPIAYLSIFLLSRFYSGIRPKILINYSKAITSICAILAPILFCVVLFIGPSGSPILGNNFWGFSLKIDNLSMLMLCLISVLGFFVLRFSYNYLDGDKRQGYFLGAIAITMCSVCLLVLSGQLLHLVLAWIATSLSLHKLLVYYKERPKAVCTANKKFLVARIGDLALIGAAFLIGSHFNTSDLTTIFSQSKDLLNTSNLPFSIHLASILILLAGALKSAQFPTQAWLVEVMETPTPVSALLHAGILNAGIFLIVRFSNIIVLSPLALALAVLIGTLTALISSSVMLTQSNIKTSLAYSSAAHMGFMMIQCGLGCYSLAILHLVAHSFYKAHAFLSAGVINRANEKFSLIESAKKLNLSSWQIIFISTLIASLVVTAIAVSFQISPFDGFQNLSLTVFLIAGLSILMAPLLKEKFNFNLSLKVLVATMFTASSFYFLEKLGGFIFKDLFVYEINYEFINYLVLSLSCVLFIVIVLGQGLIPSNESSLFWNKVFVSLKNAFYTNARFSLLVREFDIKKSQKNLHLKEIQPILNQRNLNVVLTKSLETVINKGIKRITPLWPLKDFVAVNPYHELLDFNFKDASQLVSEIYGSKMFMDKDFYLNAINNGIINEEDILLAIKEENLNDIGINELKEYLINSDITDLGAMHLPLIKDLASQYTEKDWTKICMERISLWCSNYFDKGQAVWSCPWKSQDLYLAWIEEASLDKFPEIIGLKNFREFIKSLPKDSDQMISLALSELGISDNQAERYCHRLLASINGWSSYCRYFLWEAELYGKTDSKLKDFLAVNLAWELALFRLISQNQNEFITEWNSFKQLYNSKNQKTEANVHDKIKYLLQLAFEKSWQRKLFNQILENNPKDTNQKKTLQMIFCIDVRSEVFRRNLESLDKNFQTLGFAGFFGFAVEYLKLGESVGQSQCPVLLTPNSKISETIKGKTSFEIKNIIQAIAIQETAENIWNKFKMSAVSCFSFVGPVGFAYLPKLLQDSFPKFKINNAESYKLEPNLECSGNHGMEFGLSLDKRITIAYQALQAMSLTKDFAKFIIITGHAGSAVNNPHKAGLDCGACGGHSGESNAKIAVEVLNDPHVREALELKNIFIPDDTVFLAALHDTTTDQITVFNQESLNLTTKLELCSILEKIDQASALTRKERASKLLIENSLSKNIFDRAFDWSQVRPEWALAGCSAFVAAPRSLTKDLNLEGKVFLHDYIWQDDSNFNILNLIMTAPMIVASWISYQYYAAVVDNKTFGSGNKVLHNVSGLIGVLEGNGGDLRSGLPIQSLHDGNSWIHEPRRLTVLIEAPIDQINKIIKNNELVKNLLDHQWIHLFAINSENKSLWRYIKNNEWLKENASRLNTIGENQYVSC
ncbi:MAG: hypothetical protein RLZZ361_1059 [Cyanobacteriota bacterium]|jgi:uncharacterized protein YbcC (UPF0753/DUF2309 family)/NADH:ubiquinone oxidoreductase subunit 5 (subunit L)/multisubunit Na+/H+ antiporter MnhA subunit